MILDKCSILRSHFAWLCVLFWTQFLFARSFHVCFVGGTNFGFMNGANGLRPTTTSYGMSMTVFEIWWKLNYFNHVHIRLILVGGKCEPISKQARISIKWYVFYLFSTFMNAWTRHLTPTVPLTAHQYHLVTGNCLGNMTRGMLQRLV